MLLNRLFSGARDIKIENLSTDSRLKLDSSLFFCVVGETVDGHAFAEQAIENGAVAIVHQNELTTVSGKYPDVEFIKVKDVIGSLGKAANIFYSNPSKNMDVYAVTGTNGKTSVAYLLSEVLNKFELSSYNGTQGYKIGDKWGQGVHMTTPPTLELTSLLSAMQSAGSRSVCLEVSSHGLKMRRVENLDVDVAIFTNLSRDHLDYHKTMDDYFESKALLFKCLKPSALAVINIDDEYGQRLLTKTNARVVTYGKNRLADYRLLDVEERIDSTAFSFSKRCKIYQVETNIIGGVNAYNLLALIATLSTTKMSIEEAINSVKNINFEIGRFQNVANDICNVIVDYAHTPAGFNSFFSFVNSVKSEDSAVISVFGSAGKRDKGKRRIMGMVASTYSDVIVLTEEDHRDEDVVSICKEIKEGVSEDVEVYIVPEREKAIEKAISIAKKNDVVCILGKGIETFLDRGDKSEFYIGDHEVVKKVTNIFQGQ